MMRLLFFFNDTATTEIYTLSLHDALPISRQGCGGLRGRLQSGLEAAAGGVHQPVRGLHGAGGRHLAPHQPDLLPLQLRSEEHTSELQSRQYLVCRLLLEKKTLSSQRAEPY